MSGYRLSRINEDMRRELTQVLRTVKDPRVSGMLTVLRVEVTNDFSIAKVYISSMDGEEAAKRAVEGMKSAAGYVRSQLAGRMKLRKMPELKFIADNSTERFFELDELLRSVAPKDDGDDGEKTN